MLPSFIALLLSCYAGGFVLFAFLWRWWLLLPAGAGAAMLAKWEWGSLAAADGPGVALGVALFVFLLLGAGSGLAASFLVNLGRSLGWRWLHPLLVLPLVLVLGFGSHFAYGWIDTQRRQARLAPPSTECRDGLHAVELGDSRLDLPIAPVLFVEGATREEHYVLSSNEHARHFCAATAGGPLPISAISVSLDGPPARRPESVKHAFCDRAQPAYFWAKMACSLIDVGAISDMPMKIRVSPNRPDFDPTQTYHRQFAKLTPVNGPDGIRIYMAQHSRYLERPDGYVADCYKPSSPLQPYLSCSAYAELAGKLLMSYRFRTSETLFAEQSRRVEANARAIFESLVAAD